MFLKQLLGQTDLLKKYSNFHSALVHTNDLVTPWHQLKDIGYIKMNTETPKFPMDLEVFLHLRNLCDSAITTANIIKLEEQYIEMLHRDGISFKQKHQFILSQSLSDEDIKNSSFYLNPQIHKLLPKTKFISNNQDFKKLRIHNSIEFYEENQAQVKFQEFKREHQSIYYNIGHTPLQMFIQDIDYISITLYRGPLSEQFQGQHRDLFGMLLKNFNPLFQSQTIPQYEGTIQLLTFEKK